MSGGHLHVVGKENVALVESFRITDSPEVDRAIGVLGTYPPFNNDARVEDLDFETYMAATKHAIETSGIMDAVEPVFDQDRDIDTIVVGGAGAVALKTTTYMVGESGNMHSLMGEDAFREEMEIQVGPFATPISRPITIG